LKNGCARTLRWRAVLLGLAAYVSTLPFSITFGSRGYEGLLIDDWPERIVVISIAVALHLPGAQRACFT